MSKAPLNFEQVTEVFEFVEDHSQYIKEMGLEINNDMDHVAVIMKGLKKFDGGCPCILSHPKCPCEDSIAKIEESGSCHCKLFFKKEGG